MRRSSIKPFLVENPALLIGITILIIHMLVMYSISPYGYNLSSMIRISRTDEERASRELVQKGMVVFLDRGGYDGQAYYYIAMDPFMERGVFNSPYRYQRILYPLIARILTFGRVDLLPHTLYVVNLLSLGVGMYFFILLLRHLSLHPLWSLFYGLCPPTIMTIQYDLPSPLAMALIIVAVYFYVKDRLYLTVPLLALSLLTREDSVMVLLPLVVWDWQKRKDPLRAGFLLSSVVPFVVWQVVVLLKLGSLPAGTSAHVISPVPFKGIWEYYSGVRPKNLLEAMKIMSTVVVLGFFIMTAISVLRAMKKGGHLFYYIVIAYCVLVTLTVPSQWDNYNGLVRMFYGIFPFAVLSYGVGREGLLKHTVWFIGVLFVMTVVRILFVSPVYPYMVV